MGSLILGAAGLLVGKRAACHWAWRDLLTHFGAIPTAERVVRDGNVITGGGVTGGMDFALTVLAEIAGADVAETVQLGLEYDPATPALPIKRGRRFSRDIALGPQPTSRTRRRFVAGRTMRSISPRKSSGRSAGTSSMKSASRASSGLTDGRHDKKELLRVSLLDWNGAARPARSVIEGRYCLEPLDPVRQAESLYEAATAPGKEERFRYLFIPPPKDREDFARWMENASICRRKGPPNASASSSREYSGNIWS